MALRQISRTADEQNALLNRFIIAQDDASEDISQRLAIQADLRHAIVAIATNLDIDVADSREKSLALTKLEEALLWAGKAIFV